MIDEIWEKCTRKLILIGQGINDEELSTELTRLILSDSVVILKEATSNLNVPGAYSSIDRMFSYVKDFEEFKPDLLITIGGAIVSKKIKVLLQNNQPQYHWDIRLDDSKDTFKALTHHFNVSTLEVVKVLSKSSNLESFQNVWRLQNTNTLKAHDNYLDQVEYSDLFVFSKILAQLRRESILHLANSTPVRYAQLFEPKVSLTYLSNRGVSGIDGSTSTALGYASLSPKPNILITGDMSFFYDSNAFWIDSLPTHFKIIVINNGGGGIFRYIPGPDTTNQLESVFESHHNLTAKTICEQFGLDYHRIDSKEELNQQLPSFIINESSQISLLEIMTPRLGNAKILRDYFSYIETELYT